MKVSLPYGVQIVASNPNVDPSLEKIEVEVQGIGLKSLDDNDIQQMCRIENHLDSVVLTCPEGMKFDEHLVSCRISVPIRYNLEVAIRNLGNVYLESIECSHCTVSSQQGSIILSKMKTKTLRAKTTGGHILCSGTVLGDINFVTRKNGSIQADNLQGNSMLIKTEQGSVTIKSMYAKKSQIMNVNGNVNLSNVHGTTDVLMKDGNLNIQGVDGSLNVRGENAEISVHVAQLNNVSIESNSGNVDVSLPQNVSAKVHLEGGEVSVGDDLNFVGETGPLLKQWTGKIGQSSHANGQVYIVCKKGCVSLKTLDWLSSLNLLKTDPEEL